MHARRTVSPSPRGRRVPLQVRVLTTRVLFALALALGLARPPALADMAVDGPVRIGGSGSFLALAETVGRAFRQHDRSVTFDVLPSVGSRGGALALYDGAIDVAVTSRPIPPPPGRSVRTLLLGRSPVVFVTSLRRAGLSLDEGEIMGILGLDWTAWPDGTPVRPVLRPRTESDYAVIQAAIPAMGAFIQRAMSVRKLPVALNDQENLDLAEVAEGSFAVTTLATVRAEQRDLTVIRLKGVEPSPDTVASGDYPLSKPFYATLREGADPAAQAFFEFLQTAEVRTLLRRYGVLPAGDDAGSSR